MPLCRTAEPPVPPPPPLALIVIVALADFVLSVTDVAVTVTEPPVGAVAGAVYVVAAPLAVAAGLNDPQEFAGVQVQLTPPFDESFDTVAVSDAVAPAVTDVGGLAIVTAIAGGVGVEGVCGAGEEELEQPASTQKQTRQ